MMSLSFSWSQFHNGYLGLCDVINVAQMHAYCMYSTGFLAELADRMRQSHMAG